MGKKSTVTFISMVIAIISFTIFLSLFPQGVEIVKGERIKYEGTHLNFYGGIRGEGNASIYAANSTLVINGETFHGSMLIEGKITFNSSSALFYEGKVLASHLKFTSPSCIIYSSGEKSEYEEARATLKGNISVEMDGEMEMKEGEENTTLLSRLLPEKFAGVFPLKFERLFLIREGKIWINGEEMNFSRYVFFRGEGTYKTPGSFEGKAYLIAIDGRFYEEESRIFFFPYRLIILWIVAIAIFILSLFIKKKNFREKDEIFVGAAIIFPIFFFAISFYIWNGNMEMIFGLNIFQMREINIINILFLSLSIVPYLVVVGIIGFPARVAISSLFEIPGFSTIGKMIGRCVGFILATLWGMEMMGAILNLTLSPLLRLI